MPSQPAPSLEDIKKWIIIALVSDDMLMETLVLKGGNAVHHWQAKGTSNLSRTSFDLDFSMEGDFPLDWELVSTRIERTLTDTFSEKGLIVFNFTMTERPKTILGGLEDFWGGYYVTFKLISGEEFRRLKGDMEKINRQSLILGPGQFRKVEIEISKYEFVAGKAIEQLDGYRFLIYTPRMIVFEKLRAICQQDPAYSKIVPSVKRKPRARDFYDICLITETHQVDLEEPDQKEHLSHVFEAKKVPLSFLKRIGEQADFHRQNWQEVTDTVPAGEKATLRPFEFYLRFVERICTPLTTL